MLSCLTTSGDLSTSRRRRTGRSTQRRLTSTTGSPSASGGSWDLDLHPKVGAILLESSIIYVRNYEVCYKYIPTFILEMLLHVLHSLVIILLYMEMVKYIIFLKQNPSKPGRENFNPRDGFVRSSIVCFAHNIIIAGGLPTLHWDHRKLSARKMLAPLYIYRHDSHLCLFEIIFFEPPPSECLWWRTWIRKVWIKCPD